MFLIFFVDAVAKKYCLFETVKFSTKVFINKVNRRFKCLFKNIATPAKVVCKLNFGVQKKEKKRGRLKTGPL
jgi:hypothetical protein